MLTVLYSSSLQIKTVSLRPQNSLCPLNAYCIFTDDTTGIHSVYTIYQGHEIMFHVSTMLPYSKENKQQVRVNMQNIQQ